MQAAISMTVTIDDFGCWRSYEWTDYFERIFNTRNKDVKMSMYMAMQVAK